MPENNRIPPANAILNVLIAEDDDHIRGLLVQFVTRAGFQVHSCSDGARALELIREKDFDLVISNFMMPEAGGLEVLNAVRQNQPQTLVIIMTGHAVPQPAVEAIRQSAYAYIRKPFKLHELELILKSARERIRLQQNN